jgi:F0F1-type ATP synthase membrane subunit c/vacuolar-type H+-ATPase subunit K
MAILRGMPLSKRRQLEQLAAGFLAEQAAVSLPTPQQPSDQASQDLTEPANTGPEDASSPPAASGGDRPAEPAHPPTWRSRLADACAWPVGIGMLGGFIVMGVMFESGVDSDATDPRLWGALLVCCGLAATGLSAFLDRPRSRGQVPIFGVLGLAGLIAVPLFWTSLTQSVIPQEATEPVVPAEAAEPATATPAAKLSTLTVGQTVQAGAFRIRVAAITCGYIELADLPPAEHGQYCVVVLTATNLRSYPEWLYDADQRLQVASGRSVKGYGLGSQLWDDELPPGHSVRTRLVFDLPKGVRPVGLRLQCFANQDSTREDIATIDLRR